MADMDEHYVQATEYLLEKHPSTWRCWSHLDRHRQHFSTSTTTAAPAVRRGGAKRFGNAILSVYERLDKAIARLMSRLPEGTRWC